MAAAVVTMPPHTPRPRDNRPSAAHLRHRRPAAEEEAVVRGPASWKSLLAPQTVHAALQENRQRDVGSDMHKENEPKLCQTCDAKQLPVQLKPA